MNDQETVTSTLGSSDWLALASGGGMLAADASEAIPSASAD